MALSLSPGTGGRDMATGTFECRTDAERQASGPAIAVGSEVPDLAPAAPAGRVPGPGEQQRTDRGRGRLRATWPEAVPTRVGAADVNRGRGGGARAGARSTGGGGAGGRW